MNDQGLNAWLQGGNGAVTETFYRASAVRRTAETIAAANSVDAQLVRDLNPTLKFPVSIGTRVRIGK